MLLPFNICLLACLFVSRCKISESNLKTDNLEERRVEGIEGKVSNWYKILPLSNHEGEDYLLSGH